MDDIAFIRFIDQFVIQHFPKGSMHGTGGLKMIFSNESSGLDFGDTALAFNKRTTVNE